ncbi:MurR/RpiR family transcriptional regulator [Candidatus Poribacteria bacterium]|nr:MurR/RpiR family transcriptional regulator [Candidatus Poribacteria bacterium]
MSEKTGGLLRVQKFYQNLSPTAKKIADYILKNPGKVIHLSITELAEEVKASEATIVRFCQELGYKGYQELKIRIAQSLVSAPQELYEAIDRYDEVPKVKAKVFQAIVQTLNDTLEVLDENELERAVDAIANAGRVEFYGVGGSGVVAQDAYHKFLRIGLNCIALIDSHLQVMSASLLTEKDVAVGISRTGCVKDTVEALQTAREAGAKTICITNFGKTPITEVADIKLFTAARETLFGSDAMTTRIAQLAVMDILCVGVALRRYELARESIKRTREATIGKRF